MRRKSLDDGFVYESLFWQRDNSCSDRKVICARTKYIYINGGYRYILVWFRWSDIPTKCQSPDSLYFLITFGICKQRKYYFSTFLSTPNTKKHKKIVGERTSTSCVLSYRHDNFYCAGMIIVTLRIIFFRVLRKCYKITVQHSNFYLEFPYSFPIVFFSVQGTCSNKFLTHHIPFKYSNVPKILQNFSAQYQSPGNVFHIVG